MKKEELSFKCFTATPERNRTLLSALMAAGIISSMSEDRLQAEAVVVSDCEFTYWCRIRNLEDSDDQSFKKCFAQEVTLQQAIKLIESIEPEATDGEWVELVISDRGMTSMPSFTIPIADINHTYCWVDHIGAECDSGLIFGGWWFDDFKAWSSARMGMTGKRVSQFISEWDYPLTPTKIRFWRPNDKQGKRC